MNKTGCSAVVAHLSGGQVVAGSNPVTPNVLFVAIYIQRVICSLFSVYKLFSFISYLVQKLFFLLYKF